MNKETKKFNYLDPRFLFISGVVFLFEKLLGKKDAKDNQVCTLNDGGHTTPTVNSKVRNYESHINKIFLKTVNELKPVVEEAYLLVAELKTIMANQIKIIEGTDTEAQRKKAKEEAREESNRNRKDAIVRRLAEIRGELDVVDEMLVHYVERAEGLLHSRISKYWKGVLCVNRTDKLEPFPIINKDSLPGLVKYQNNRDELLSMIKNSCEKMEDDKNENIKE